MKEWCVISPLLNVLKTHNAVKLIVKELEEDKLYAYVEFDLDRINLKDSRQQSDIDMMKTIQLHASPYLLSIPGVSDAFARLDRSLAQLLIPYMNDIGKRRKYSSDHLAMLKPLVIDPEIADNDDDDFDEDFQHTPPPPTRRSAPLVSALETATPSSVSSVRTTTESSVADDFSEGYRWPDNEQEAVFEEEINARSVSFEDSLASAFWDAEGEGTPLFGTFTPLRHPHQAHSRSSPTRMLPTPARPLSKRLAQSAVRPPPARRPATYRLVRVEELPHGDVAADAATSPYILQSSSPPPMNNRNRSGRQMSQGQQDSNASPTTRLRLFRPSRQEDHSRR